MENEQFSLCWNNFHNNLSSGFHNMLQNEDLVDVTLAAEGRYLKAHKMVLSVCSPYFKDLFRTNPCKHPIVILHDVTYSAIRNLLEFMYQGEVSVGQEEIPSFMKAAATLKIKGLTDHSSAETNGISNYRESSPSPYNSMDPKASMMSRIKPAKKIIKPIQHLRRIESPKTDLIKSPERARSPQPPPSKRRCADDSDDLDGGILCPKQEPAEHSDDDYKDRTFGTPNFNTCMLDSSLGEPSNSSGNWTPDFKPSQDTSSPGTLQCIIGRRGNPRLIVDGHVFYKKSSYKGKSFWYCKHSRSVHKCQAVSWTLGGQIVKWPGAHTHPVIPDSFNPEDDVDVPFDKLQEVLLQSSFS